MGFVAAVPAARHSRGRNVAAAGLLLLFVCSLGLLSGNPRVLRGVKVADTTETTFSHLNKETEGLLVHAQKLQGMLAGHTKPEQVLNVREKLRITKQQLLVIGGSKSLSASDWESIGGKPAVDMLTEVETLVAGLSAAGDSPSAQGHGATKTPQWCVSFGIFARQRTRR